MWMMNISSKISPSISLLKFWCDLCVLWCLQGCTTFIVVCGGQPFNFMPSLSCNIQSLWRVSLPVLANNYAKFLITPLMNFVQIQFTHYTLEKHTVELMPNNLCAQCSADIIQWFVFFVTEICLCMIHVSKKTEWFYIKDKFLFI